MRISEGKNRILFVTTSMGRGGAERVVSILANYYASIEWEVEIIMLWHNIVEYPMNSSVRIVDLSSDNRNSYARIPSVVRKLRKEIKRVKPKAVVSFIAQNNIISKIAISGLKVRFIPSERIDPSSMKRNIVFKKCLEYAYSHSTVTVLQTYKALHYFPEKVQKKSVVIYNPVTVNLCVSNQSEKIIVTAGRLEPQKNHAMLIKAFSRFHELHPDFSMTIYGDGSLRCNLEEMIKTLDLEESVSLPGNILDIHKKMSEAYMFVLSSDFEGMSNSLMEAMALGLPCISTNCAGSDELITDGENGYLIPIGDEDALLEAMIRLAENSSKAKKIGMAARAFSHNFTTENVIMQWRNAIEGEH